MPPRFPGRRSHQRGMYYHYHGMGAERTGMGYATAIKAGLVFMDDRAGVTAAREKGLRATGTLGVLDLAARRGLIDLAAAFARLKTTSFYYRQGLLDALLAARKKAP